MLTNTILCRMPSMLMEIQQTLDRGFSCLPPSLEDLTTCTSTRKTLSPMSGTMENQISSSPSLSIRSGKRSAVGKDQRELLPGEIALDRHDLTARVLCINNWHPDKLIPVDNIWTGPLLDVHHRVSEQRSSSLS